ncbi:flagellar protein FliT [Trinickia fusca]|uniref:Flagellar protein FliT n=1 Tax=Trinickia fusca TaxID=2419777 RepID=A0A494X5G1_9BURK|nr:flagellar protein FliT [Trinickia fusca]RKP45610.1 flagellar protein FliT [Trinickia fusca]
MSHESLQRAHELTRTLVVAMEAGDWQFAADLADERSPLLMSLGPDQTDEGLAMIREIQSMNDTIESKAREACDAISTSYSEAQRRVAAAGQYLATP